MVPDYFFNPSLEENQILVDNLCTELLQGELCKNLTCPVWEIRDKAGVDLPMSPELFNATVLEMDDPYLLTVIDGKLRSMRIMMDIERFRGGTYLNAKHI